MKFRVHVFRLEIGLQKCGDGRVRLHPFLDSQAAEILLN
jgi:hypothetical protein